MAIVCPGCRREYDVTLFQLGRTIHCTCGRRVGLEHRLTVSPAGTSTRFIADAMLGRLARWLRTLGYDTAYDDAISDEELIRRSIEEGRHIITRDRRLFEEWRVEGLLVDAGELSAQLRQVVRAFQLPRPTRLFTRCRSCNTELESVELERVRSEIPERVARRLEDGGATGATRGEGAASSRVARCPECRKVYWEGTHTDRMRAVVAEIFEGGDGSGGREAAVEGRRSEASG